MKIVQNSRQIGTPIQWTVKRHLVHLVRAQMMFDSLLRSDWGVYQDDCQGLHPDTIEKYYGVHGPPRLGGRGAGNPPDENDVAENIHAEQGPQIRHEAIEVPDHKNPFGDDSEGERTFFAVLTEVVWKEVVPTGYGVLPEEWDEDGYPDTEILQAGRRMKTQIPVSLSHPIWLQRATLWVQGVNVLSRFF
ncbi:hypothetical protein MSAN_00893500 [Mycena sanguinolenta]|uniref:Uncharacterized protein n=1 Tax=Mycena sanguinolenta TaxID=230812 RepID=A0A8H7D9L2_9AGAR|nr:hypothetical protein MSAN_00893500 [Mycena sanguinolenta]